MKIRELIEILEDDHGQQESKIGVLIGETGLYREIKGIIFNPDGSGMILVDFT